MMRYKTMTRILVVTLLQMWICITVLTADLHKAYFRGTNTYTDLLPTEVILRSMATKSRIECGLACLGDPRCPGFFHDGGNCHALSKNMDDLVSAVPSPSMTYYEKKDCGAPPTETNVTWEPGTTYMGSVRRYTCPPILLPSVEDIRCLRNGSWSQQSGFCRDCGLPPTEKDVTWDSGATHLGSVRQYTCRADLIPTVPDIQCLQNGSWSQQSGFCRTLRAKEIRNFSIKAPSDTGDCTARGVVYLPGGRIVVTEYYNKLKLFTDGGQYLDELTVRGYLYDMCLVDNNTVAVAVRSPGCVRVVNVGSSKLSLIKELDISFGYMNCYGIAYTNGMFIVSTIDGSNGKVHIMAEDGTADLLQVYSAKSYSIASDPTNQGQVLVALYTRVDVIVSRLSVASKQATVVQNAGVFTGPFGIDVDAEGNIYATGLSSNKVVRMSPDGTNLMELLTSSDGIDKPQVIAVSGDKFALTFGSRPQRNFIRIYQLY